MNAPHQNFILRRVQNVSVILMGMAAWVALFGTPLALAQVVEGIDCSARSNPADTFEMTGDDVFGKRFASEHLTLIDEVTGAEIIALTTSRHQNSKVYQTHPQWTPDGRYIIFRSSRGGNDESRRGFSYAISMENYEIVQVTTGDWGNDLHLGWKHNLAWFFENGELKELNLGRLLFDSEQGTVGKPSSYCRSIATLPDGLSPSGGVGLDANEQRLFFAARLPEGRSGIFGINFATGETTQLFEVPFRANHLQANPYVSGEIMYCWETGGDAPQRMWYLAVQPDGSVENRPVYVEKPTEWVTHEVFVGPDHIMFNVMAHLDRLRENPTGIFTLNLRTNEHINRGQIGKGGYWHCDGTRDLEWAVGDSFDGDLYRLNLTTGESTLLTTGHRPDSEGPFTREAHSHHNISPDGEWVLLNSSMLTESDIMLVRLHPD